MDYPMLKNIFLIATAPIWIPICLTLILIYVICVVMGFCLAAAFLASNPIGWVILFVIVVHSLRD